MVPKIKKCICIGTSRLHNAISTGDGMPTEPMLHDGTFFQEKAGGDRLSGMREAAGQTHESLGPRLSLSKCGSALARERSRQRKAIQLDRPQDPLHVIHLSHPFTATTTLKPFVAVYIWKLLATDLAADSSSPRTKFVLMTY